MRPMTRTAHIFLLSLVLAGFATACASVFVSNLRTIRQDESLALFAIADRNFPTDPKLRAQMPGMTKMPALSLDQVKGLLGNVEYRKETIWGFRRERVFTKEQLEFLAPTVTDALPTLKPGDRMVIVSRFDPDRSVLSRQERVTVMLWADKAGLNLLFGEIRFELPNNDYFEVQDWTRILPISLRQPFPYHSLVPAGFTLKRIDGFVHRTWAVFDPASVQQLSYKKDSGKKLADGRRLNFQARRRTLKRLRDSGVITKSEYDEKEIEIRNDEKRQLLRDALETGLINRAEFDAKMKDLAPAQDEPVKDEPTKEEPGMDPDKEPGKPEKSQTEKGEEGKSAVEGKGETEEPGKGQPTKGETGKTEPANGERGKTQPVKDERTKTQPAKDAPAKSEPVKTESAKTDPAADVEKREPPADKGEPGGR